MKTINGSCHCGGVTFTLNSSAVENSKLCHCHCKICTKIHGSVFASFFRVPCEEISWNISRIDIKTILNNNTLERSNHFDTNYDTNSVPTLVGYRSSPLPQGSIRYFCRICSTPIKFQYDREPGFVWLVAGAIDSKCPTMATLSQRSFRQFVENGPCWYDVPKDGIKKLFPPITNKYSFGI